MAGITNIGIVTTWFDRGAAYVSQAYLETLSKAYKVFIYVRGNEISSIGDPHWEKENVTWGKTIHTGIPTFIIWSDFKKWVIQNDIQVILFNEQQSWDVIIRSQNLGVILGAYIDFYTPQTVPFFWLYDFLICNTKRHYSVFDKHPQCLFVPWGTNCNLYTPLNKGTISDEITFFHSCGMSPYRKGLDILIKAFQNVKGKAKLVIHSQVQFENLEISRLIRADHRIEVIVKTVPPPNLYYLGDVYVYPTRLEGIGLTIIEALACGLPVITTDNGPMNEFVESGKNGLLVPVEKYQTRVDGYYWEESICNQDALTQQMQHCINYPDKVKALKIEARKSAIQFLNWEKNSANLLNEINSLSSLKKPAFTKLQVSWYEYCRYPALVLDALKRTLMEKSLQ